jgi:hypothetical protein
MKLNKFYSVNSTWHGVPLSIVLTLSLSAIALLLRFVFAWTSLENLPATSDEASNVLLAKMIVHGELPLLFIGQPYQFPIEAYLMAPFVEWLPRTAFGARYQTLVFGLLSMFGFLLIVRAAFPRGARWPAGLLVLFPSSYLLMLTSAYAPPQYSIALTLAWISIYLVLRYRQKAKNSLLALVGLTCGLAFSNHLLTVTISIGVFAVIVFGGSVRRGLKGVLFFAAGFLVGVIPYLLAIWLEPGAYEGLPKSLALSKVFLRLIRFVLTESFPGAMGINPSLFPDFDEYLRWPRELKVVFAAGYILLLGFLFVRRLQVFYEAVRTHCWPKLDLVDMALIASILMFGLFAYHNTDSSSFRHMLPAVWCFPFLIGHAYMDCSGRWKIIIGGAVLVLSIFNVVTSAAVIREWRKPDQVMKYADTPSIESLLDVLESKNITHCYASFWLAYRITFESDEKIVCTLPYNERFFHWPVPYKKEVDGAPDAVYILSQDFGARLTAQAFQRHLEVKGIDTKWLDVKVDEEAFFIFYDFNYPPSQEEHVLKPNEYIIKTNNDIDSSPALNSEEKGVDKIFPNEQEEDEWLEVNFKTPQVITSITLLNLPLKTREKENIRILVNDKKGSGFAWRFLSHDMHLTFERIGFHHNRPIYDALSQYIRITPMQIDGLRVEIKEVDKKRQRGFPELEIHVKNQENF